MACCAGGNLRLDAAPFLQSVRGRRRGPLLPASAPDAIDLPEEPGAQERDPDLPPRAGRARAGRRHPRDDTACPLETSRQTTNSWGSARPRNPIATPRMRVVVLGDSFMQGMFIGDDETPPECLRGLLARPHEDPGLYPEYRRFGLFDRAVLSLPDRVRRPIPASVRGRERLRERLQRPGRCGDPRHRRLARGEVLAGEDRRVLPGTAVALPDRARTF